MNFTFLYDRQPQALRDRLSARRRRRPGAPRSPRLRPARVGGTARELRGDRQGRRAGEPLVPPRPPGHERPRRAGAAVLERVAVRVPDAAAPHAQLSRHAARRLVPHGAAPADGLRRVARQCRGASPSPRTTSSIATATTSTRRSACPVSDSSAVSATSSSSRRTRRRSPTMIEPARSVDNLRRLERRRRARRVRLLRRHRLHRPRRAPSTTGVAGPGGRHRSSVLRPPPGHDARGDRQRAARRPHGQAIPRGSARQGDRAAAAGARSAARAPTTEPRPRRDARRAAAAGRSRSRRYRTPHTLFPHTQFLSNGRYVAAVTNAGGGWSICGGLAVTRSRRDRHLRRRQPVPLPARRPQRRGLVADLPSDTRRGAKRYTVLFLPENAPFSRRARRHRHRSSTSPSPPKTTWRSAGSR